MTETVNSLTASACTLSSPLFTSPNRLKLGAFHMNCTRGGSLTMAEGSIAQLDWEQQVRIAQAAERAGFEAIVPIARWRGYPGKARFNMEQYEVMPWAAGIAASTSSIVVFATAHVPLIHPIRLAKEVATIDHIARGRFCLNVVAGWNSAELDMFGVTQREHDERYEVADEWMTLVKRLWDEPDEFDFEGRHFTATEAVSLPKPLQQPRPPIMSAGTSAAGREFAARHADVCFAVGSDLEALSALAADIKERAAVHGREVGVWLSTAIVCGDTEAEAKKRYDHYVHVHGDWDTAAAEVEMAMGGGMQSVDWEVVKHLQEGLVLGQMAYNLVGSPEQIVEKMDGLSNAGLDGISVIWPDYELGLEQFREQILPVAVEAGLRAG